VATALGIQERARVPLLTLLATSLARRDMLLILDNCEHLITACAELADQLLRACPRVRILASSRQPLAVAGEQLFQVPPLSTYMRLSQKQQAHPRPCACSLIERVWFNQISHLAAATSRL
jgi:predicted ATPase